jgi:hypothetical protein
MSDRDPTPTHEAAHAVVGLVLGLPISQVTREVEEWDLDGSVGVSFPADYTPAAYPDLAEAQSIVSLAGPLAEERLTGTIDFAGARGDLEGVFQCAEAIAGEDGNTFELVRAWQRRASALVVEHWREIEVGRGGTGGCARAVPRR